MSLSLRVLLSVIQCTNQPPLVPGCTHWRFRSRKEVSTTVSSQEEGERKGYTTQTGQLDVFEWDPNGILKARPHHFDPVLITDSYLLLFGHNYPLVVTVRFCSFSHRCFWTARPSRHNCGRTQQKGSSYHYMTLTLLFLLCSTSFTLSSYPLLLTLSLQRKLISTKRHGMEKQCSHDSLATSSTWNRNRPSELNSLRGPLVLIPRLSRRKFGTLVSFKFRVRKVKGSGRMEM